MASNTNELDINSMVSNEATTTPEDIVEFPLIPKKTVEKKQKKKKTDKKVEMKDAATQTYPNINVEKSQIGKEELLEQLNKPTYLERKHISDLETSPHSYMVESVERVTTKYGDAIIATLDDEGDRFKVFLPKRYTTKICDESIEYMNKTTIHLKYLGGKYHELQFC